MISTKIQIFESIILSSLSNLIILHSLHTLHFLYGGMVKWCNDSVSMIRRLIMLALLHSLWKFTRYLHATVLLQCLQQVHQRPCHGLQCLCDNGCKRCLVVCCKSMAFCLIVHLSLCSLHLLNRDVNMNTNTKYILKRYLSPTKFYIISVRTLPSQNKCVMCH